MALDKATRAFLKEMAESGAPPIHEGTPDQARALAAGLVELFGDGPPMHLAEDHRIKGLDAEFDVRVLKPAASPRGVFVYYHGGGWVLGSLDEFDTLGRRIAADTGCTVVLVDYRLAPEHPYPAAVNDAGAAVEWAAANRDTLASPNAPIILAGDSAGANLATVTARRARDRQGPEIALQVLVYPVTDANLNRPSYLDPDNQLFLDRDGMIWFWDHYLPDKTRRNDPDASPLQAESLENLPPAVMIQARHDVLYDEGKAYAQRLKDAGVEVTVHEHDDQMHCFFNFVMLPGSLAAHEQICSAVKQCLESRLVE